MERAVIDASLRKAAERVLERCRARGLQVATAESCTGGLVASLLTDVPGSSAYMMASGKAEGRSLLRPLPGAVLEDRPR